jgi:hypothetical protein
MREIIPQKLWLGNTRDASDVTHIHDFGIRAIIDLAFEESPLQLTRDLMYFRFPIVDGEGNAPELLSLSIATTSMIIRNDIPLLIACSAGMSRSPAILSASLAVVRSQPPDEVLQELIQGNPHDVSPPLWVDVKTTYEKLISG